MAGGLLQGTGAWDTAGNWSSAAVATTGDLASVPKSQQNAVVGPTGANQQVDLDILHTHPEFEFDAGSSGAPITLAASLVHVQGSGNFYFEAHLDAGSAFITNEVRVECASAAAKVEIGSVVGDAGTIERVNINRGDVTLTGTIVYAAGGTVVVNRISGEEDAKVKAVSTGATIPEYIQMSGRGMIDSVVTRLAIHGGTCVKAVNKAVTIDIFAGGILVYNHAAVGGEVVICRVHPGGVLDLNQNGELKVFDLTILYHGGVIHSTSALHTLNLVDMDREG